jgi:dienelactone hydrolase
VVWYGLPPLEYVDAAKIKAPLMAHWAEQDGPSRSPASMRWRPS